MPWFYRGIFLWNVKGKPGAKSKQPLFPLEDITHTYTKFWLIAPDLEGPNFGMSSVEHTGHSLQTTRHSFWRANSWKMRPKWPRIFPKIAFLRYWDTDITWYLQSHLKWERLWYKFDILLSPMVSWMYSRRKNFTAGTLPPNPALYHMH